MEPIIRFKEIFWDGFQRPPLKSEKYQQLFTSLETVNDQLAGPLYSVYEKGDCTYIFSDNERFPDIKSPQDLFEKMEKMVSYYKEKAESEKPADKTEEDDQQMLLFQSDIKMELSELCLVINEQKIKNQQ